MKTEQCLMCIVCFVLGWFVHNVVGKCGFGTEHLKTREPHHDANVACRHRGGKLVDGDVPGSVKCKMP